MWFQNSLTIYYHKEDQIRNIIIAYEPVWAIGTGLTASPEDAQNMHKHIRDSIANQFSLKTAENISILYGGSCKPEMRKIYFHKKILMVD